MVEISQTPSFEYLVGQSYTSDWMPIDQDLIDRFADVTFDRQYIHVDPERAALTPFAGTIAHGFLVMSLLPHLNAISDRPVIPGLVMGINYGFEKLRFVSPVRSGSEIRAIFTIAEITRKAPDRFQRTADVVVEIRGSDRPALVGKWLSQFVVSI